MATKEVHRSYKYRFYPTDEQAQQLAQTFGCVRYVYNRALAERSKAWAVDKKRVTYFDTGKMLTQWRNEEDTAWLSETTRVPQQYALMHLQTAFDAFWRKQSRYPKFKKKNKSRDSATYNYMAFYYVDGKIKLAKMKDPLDIRWSRPLPKGIDTSKGGDLRSVTVSRNSRGQYFVSILVREQVEQLKPIESKIGIDVGLTTLLTLSTGEKIANPRHERKDRVKLAKAQREMSRKQKGSKNRAKARLKVAKVHGRITDRRRDHLHKLTTRLVRENQVIAIEDLSVRNMVKNHNLARAISDASWGTFRQMLEYKAEWYGREVITIDRWYPSSKTCSECGTIVEKLPLNIREWECCCGAVHDRDVNAAKNILAAGSVVEVYGDGVRPSRAKREKATVCEVETS